MLLFLMSANFLDPVKYFGGQANYISFWHSLFVGVFTGIGSKILSLTSLVIGFWFLVKRENIYIFLIAIILSFGFAYLGNFIHIF
ncbi:MAG: hypothetical protein QXH07_05405 [Thermoplasmata archaeon]